MLIEPLLGAKGIQEMLHKLQSHHGRSGNQSFPISDEWRDVDLTCKTRDIAGFFSNLVQTTKEKNGKSVDELLRACEIAPGLAVFFKTVWDENHINYFSLTAIAMPEGGLGELLDDEPPVADYYRFEHDQSKPGQIFSHPILHIHSQPSGAPRFPFALNSVIYPAFSVLEFLMIQYHYDSWMEWLLYVHAKRHFGTVPPDRPLPRQIADAHSDPDKWGDIDAALRSSFVAELKDCSCRVLIEASEGLPLLNPQQLVLNYW